MSPLPVRPILPVAKLLPLDARDDLRRAASIDPKREAGESPARAAAVDAAIQRTRAKYPQFFR